MNFSLDYANFYEEIKTYYPRFYDDVLEMDAIWQADGDLIDNVKIGLNSVINDNFIATADSDTLTKWEKFLGLETDLTQDIEIRRKTILAFVGGSGKISGSALKQMIKSITGADADINFNTQDTFGNFILKTNLKNGSTISSQLWANIFKLYHDRLPAHIATEFGLEIEGKQDFFIGGTATISMIYGG